MTAPTDDRQAPSARGGAVLEELQWRGLLSHTTDLEELHQLMDEGPVTFYLGCDPTAASLHVGHLVQLCLMRRLQEAGHHPVVLVGGATGLIGDPRPTSERTLNDPEVVAGWVQSIADQVRPFVSFEGENAARLVNNLDWFSGLGALDFLRDVGKHFRVNQMLKKDSVSARLESEQGISYTEFSYQILQGYDYWHLHIQEGVQLQIGGQDQWGNLMAGVDFVHRKEGRSVHAITSPLVTDSTGKKFGKSEGNAIWLDPEMTSAWTFFQFWLNAEDVKVVEYLKLFTFLTREQIDELAAQVEAEPFKRAAQRALAREMTAMVHGEQATADVEVAAAALFGKGSLREVPVNAILDATRELEGAEVRLGDTWVDVVVATGLADSRKSAKRFLAEGAISVNGETVSADGALEEGDLLGERVAVVKRGRKNMAAARVTSDPA
ncbi:tyrosyl-tRNA synthetase [Kytococcus aerolatus]|uniref:Tyrosine--tRNA ligase n=1 Tax=Kytococcus aerolatus TaxID=592308 RepID=A0A212U2S0_9MICO|nr:tyrosine--tRNA ligase [Kytococcus aerolatus]SNC72542.1 tyrosyl-tRNA synthetase [Kytococcus aerolatus]